MLVASLTKQQGFTLTEIMIGATIGLIILAAATTVYVSTLKSGTNNIQMTRLTQEMRAGLRLMGMDIRRAGYYGGVPGVDDFTNNPFMAGANDVSTGAYAGEPANSCILFSYDRDDDATVDTGLVDTDGDGIIDSADMEQYGFRLRAGAIEVRTGGAVQSCTVDNGWEAITDPATSVDQLQFDLAITCLAVNDGSVGCPCASGEPCQQLREVGIALQATRVGDANSRFQASEIIQIRNHKFIGSAP